jgi:hypothetical protein
MAKKRERMYREHEGYEMATGGNSLPGAGRRNGNEMETAPESVASQQDFRVVQLPREDSNL